MNKNLLAGLIWMNRKDARDWVHIKSVEDGTVTYEVRTKIKDGPSYDDSTWGFAGGIKTLSVKAFESQYNYYRPFNLKHEHDLAKEYLASAFEVVVGAMDMDTGEAEQLLDLFAKTVVNEAAVRIELMPWNTGCCGDDASKAADAIERPLSAEEIEALTD